MLVRAKESNTNWIDCLGASATRCVQQLLAGWSRLGRSLALDLYMVNCCVASYLKTLPRHLKKRGVIIQDVGLVKPKRIISIL